ncbi:Queuosine salvage protein [Aphelenchoides besseyi]|nr:Queuosine salvage protein [Aphelenchoides besseyi]KAI6229199.1 Queuosine salvage protein [Aphelenchoides besseyi]
MSIFKTCSKLDWDAVGDAIDRPFKLTENEMDISKKFDLENLLWPYEVGKFVADHTNLVNINEQKIRETAELVYEATKKESLEKLEFHAHVLHPKFDNAEQQARWVMLADTINFAFWSAAGGAVEYDGKQYTGYYSAAALMKHAIDAGWYAILDPYCWQKMTMQECKQLFVDKLPLMHLRLKAINEAGNVLVKKYDGLVLNLLKAADGSAQRLIQLLVRDFSSFRDGTRFEGKTLMFLKRAQIFAADVYSALKNDSTVPYAKFKDIDTLTMFADYRVPQVLYHMGVLEYDEKLKKRLFEFKTLPHGHKYETAIRGLSIYAVQKITSEVRRLCDERGELKRSINNADIDVFLWLHRREHAAEVEKSIPHHAVVTWFY